MYKENEMNVKIPMMAAALMTASALFAESQTPVVSEVEMTQADVGRRVTITYKLNLPAVVTLDIETNGPNGWVSIGGEHIQRVSGDVWKKVSGKESYSMVWRPDLDWPDHVVPEGGARAKVTAWASDNTPKYMVVDITASAINNPDKVRYYPEAEFLPGGLLQNPAYKTTSLVMRRIPAAGVEWTMGSVEEPGRDSERETAHKVTLSDDYYIGVFPVTQGQWMRLAGYNYSVFKRSGDLNHFRPVDSVSYNEIRLVCGKDVIGNHVYADDSANLYPAAPHADSFLGKLRTLTGIAFDLPSEAQWEFAARAGHGEWRWGNGALYTQEYGCKNIPGRYQRNGGCLPGETWPPPSADCDETKGTSFVGSYDANGWGLYDCHGNIQEFCLGWFKKDITQDGGAVITVANSSQLRVARGGAWQMRTKECRSAFRNTTDSSGRYQTVGLRLFCPMGE